MFRITLAALFAVAGIVATPIADPQGAHLTARADTPNFYFVTTSSDPAFSLKPLRFDSSGSSASLTASGDPLQFFLEGGDMKAVAAGSTFTTFISFTPTGTGCSTDGQVNFVAGSSTNKCANHQFFNIQANSRMSSLGSQLVNNFTGGFWACGPTQTIYYNSTPDAPSGLACTKVTLQTVPITP